MLYRLDDMGNQVGSVVHDLDDHIVRQRTFDLFKPDLERLGDVLAVLTHQHEGQTEHDFASALRRHRAAPNLVPDLRLGHVADVHGSAVV